MEVELPKTVAECHSLIRQLVSVIEKMQTEIDELKARLKENSQNSHRPPSSDGFTKPKPALTKKKRRRGGQWGHSGETLRQVAAPDAVVACEPQRCDCGTPAFGDVAQIVERRQVFDLPEPRLEVVEYQLLERTCECGRRVCGKFPEGVAGQVQYGVKVQAMVTLLSVHGCLSHRKIGQLFGDLYGYELNEATTQAMVQRSAAQMPLETLKAGLRRAGVAHFDETSLRVGGQLWWLHNASTKDLTYQFVDEKRGGAALTSEKSILPEFDGIAVHDCWASYFGFGELRHALCNAHILRELTGLIENSQSHWAAQMKELLLSLYQQSECGQGIIADMGAFEARYGAILRAGEAEEPPPQRTHAKGKLKRSKGRNLLERLSKHQEAVLRFAKLAEVPFTNNQAERDIRPVKVKQKVSGGFRAPSGAESYTRIYSFISTLRKLKRQVFQELRSVIEGHPFVLSQT